MSMLAKVVCQQCGKEAQVSVRVDGLDNQHIELPNGWLPVWVADDEKAKITCGGCLES